MLQYAWSTLWNSTNPHPLFQFFLQHKFTQLLESKHSELSTWGNDCMCTYTECIECHVHTHSALNTFHVSFRLTRRTHSIRNDFITRKNLIEFETICSSREHSTLAWICFFVSIFAICRSGGFLTCRSVGLVLFERLYQEAEMYWCLGRLLH